ncbi:MAG TPA: hypothetical protein VGH02_12395 [Rhizomicrobium sp.]|jgi:hypothetical protein
MKKSITRAALAGLLGLGGLALAATSASAYIVCNDDGECWHVHDQYTYPTGFGIVVHDDSWKWDADHDARVHWRWHEHEGRGYWRNGVWVTF